MKKAFILVGHSNWGKSKTLYHFTGQTYVHSFMINGKNLEIKRMSNDDIYEELFPAIERLINREIDYLIIAFCPNFVDPRKKAEEILKKLREKYNLYFFVLHKKYGSNKYISEDELVILKSYGIVENFSLSEDANNRAEAFKKFIESNI
jgi:hypothetical protein